MSDIGLPPPCPLCSGKMVLKDSRKLAKAVMRFFGCTACGVEYPRASDSPAPSAAAPVDRGGR